MKRLSLLYLLPLSALASSQAYAVLDHEWSLDQSGILQDGVIALELAGSLWFGNYNDDNGH